MFGPDSRNKIGGREPTHADSRPPEEFHPAANPARRAQVTRPDYGTTGAKNPTPPLPFWLLKAFCTLAPSKVTVSARWTGESIRAM